MLQSKQCQKSAWPVHKNICKLNRETHDVLLSRPGDLERFEALRDFTRKYHANISEAAFYSVRIKLSTGLATSSRDREDVLVIELRTRPNALRA